MRKPQECGIILRQTTERICRIYNTYYQIGYPQNASLEEFCVIRTKMSTT